MTSETVAPAPGRRAAAVPAGRAGFREALAFEWIKFRSLRSTLWVTAVATLLPAPGAVLVAATDSIQPDDTVLGGALTLATPALMLAAVLGALVICGEYGGGTMRATVAAVPRRGTVLAAKATLLAGLLYALALPSCTAAYLVGDALLDDTYAPGDPLPALFGIAATFPVAGLFGLAVGTLIRHGAGAITSVIAVLLLPGMLGPLFGPAERWVAGVSPTAALQKLTQSSDAAPELAGSLGGWPSLLLVAGYTALALLGAAALFQRRDV
ncbi:ABC transporter permease subunit [Streptomyces sp. 3MP-14]|uniref:ABC transporter permease subunit n=1 Tax=Streptomyces mimosae TaxID=2586635 RepID=A0A5N6A792_9ACTN|nr:MULTISPECIES: ABC transporter permease subunit [Streptomyces]KAB8163809.1 ABC transporter permease subunit [Streptomyces mimosae]KAB8175252.1 ABC transporter permease subunit [Streptomyces sp. 3MP-14]